MVSMHDGFLPLASRTLFLFDGVWSLGSRGAGTETHSEDPTQSSPNGGFPSLLGAHMREKFMPNRRFINLSGM